MKPEPGIANGLVLNSQEKFNKSPILFRLIYGAHQVKLFRAAILSTSILHIHRFGTCGFDPMWVKSMGLDQHQEGQPAGGLRPGAHMASLGFRRALKAPSFH